MMFSAGLLILATQQTRFQSTTPIPGLPPLILDSFLNNYKGPAKQVCEKYGLEGRVLWIDATANIERYNTEEKIIALVDRIRQSGFNTIVFDVKPLSSEMVYPSKFAPKLQEWKGKQLGDFDPLGPMCREARKHKLNIYVSMNAFCDGHRLVNRGPGFQRPDEQSVIYEPTPIIRINGEVFEVSAKPEAGKVTVSTDALTLPEGQTGYSIACNKRGVMLAEGALLPKGGYFIHTLGNATDKLKSLHGPGTSVEFDSTATFVRIGESQDKQYPLMTSPTNPSVRRRLMDIAKEVVTGYDIDGIIYDDRLRYTGLNGDFSELTRSMFEQAVSAKLNWPDDVFKYTYSYSGGLQKGVRPGKYYDRWMTWRANILKNFAKDARATIKAIRPKVSLGVYAGSWYGDYQQYGNNWAAPAVEAGFWFMTPEYRQSGMAPALDFLVTGCYYPTATVYDAMGEARGIGNTVEASGNLSYRAVHDQTFVYAGLSLMDFKENPEGLTKAIQAAVATTNGVMVFDLSHDIEPMWAVFEKAFAKSKRAPHASEGYLLETRRLRNAMDRKGLKEPPLIIAAGSAGIGF
jgi:hypothetical protein